MGECSESQVCQMIASFVMMISDETGMKLWMKPDLSCQFDPKVAVTAGGVIVSQPGHSFFKTPVLAVLVAFLGVGLMFSSFNKDQKIDQRGL